MGFLNAEDLGARNHTHREKRICKRRESAPVVKSVRYGNIVLLRNVLIESHRGEVLSDGLFGIGRKSSYAAPQVGAIRLRPKGHKGKHARVQIGDSNQAVIGSDRQKSPPRVVVGNKGDVGNP